MIDKDFEMKSLTDNNVDSVTPFERAYSIIMDRSEDPDRQYGDIDENFGKTAALASIMSGKELTTEDCYNVMIALKLSRESNAHKEDNYVDAIAYMGALANYKEKKCKNKS